MSVRTFVALALLAPACQATKAPPTTAEPEVERLREQVAALERRLAEAEGSSPLPESLDALYAGPEQPFLGAMYGMSSAMTAIGLSLQAGEMDGAKASYGRFREAWDHASSLVPEWEDRFPDAPVDRLGAAVEQGDPQAIGAALGEVGALCSDCHHETMVAVHHRYHWGDFEAITTTGPSGETLGWDELMMALETTMTAVTWHAAAGRTDQAVAAADRLEATMRALGGTCETCHDTERRYYVDDETLALIQPMRDAAAAGDLDRLGAATGAFGAASCGRCHHVHIPAAFAHHAAEPP